MLPHTSLAFSSPLFDTAGKPKCSPFLRQFFVYMSSLSSVRDRDISISEQALALLAERFGPGPQPLLHAVPGRVNLIGEHIDYHDLPVLPMAIQRRIVLAFRPCANPYVRAVSAGIYGEREFSLDAAAAPNPSGDWGNYLKAACQAAQSRWKIARGIEAAIASDLPAAAGLASSSSLVVGFTIALLQANHICPALHELLDVLPDAEQFVGTRGGGMDHAAVLAAEAGCALLVSFAPCDLAHIPVPPSWSFLVAHSLTHAEKSGAVRAEYNARRTAGIGALQSLGLPSYRAALNGASPVQGVNALTEPQRMAFLHVTSEATRVQKAISAMHEQNIAVFGELLLASHSSLRDQLRVSSPAIDSLVEVALDAGAQGARLTGAGFGGCVLVLCTAADRDHVREQLIRNFYSKHRDFNPQNHLFVAEPSRGALVA
jgi:galactokinase